MENTLQTPTTVNTQIITSENLLTHWQGHRSLTRRVIEAFPEDKLFNYSIGGMRPFADMAKELMSLAGAGTKGIVTNDWSCIPELDYHAGTATASTKEEVLRLWDVVTEEVNTFWPQITDARFQEVVVAFGQYEGEAYGTILYLIDNEIHHRGQAYVYLRSIDIEPPSFWER